MLGTMGPLKLHTRNWGHGLWKSLCTNSNHNPYLGHFVVTTPKYWTFKNIDPPTAPIQHLPIDKYVSPRIEAKNWMHGTAKRDSFSSWIPSCFHHVDMYVDLFCWAQVSWGVSNPNLLWHYSKSTLASWMQSRKIEMLILHIWILRLTACVA